MTKSIKRIIVTAIILIVTLISYPFIQMMFFPISETTRLYYLDNAEIQIKQVEFTDTRNECIYKLIKNHKATSSNRVFLGKSYYKNNSRYTDSGFFNILSVSFPKPLEKRVYILKDDDLQLYFSKGGWHWVHHCSGVFGQDGAGLIEILSFDDGQVEAAFNIDLNTASAINPTETEIVKIEGVYSFNKAEKEEWNKVSGGWDWFLLR